MGNSIRKIDITIEKRVIELYTKQKLSMNNISKKLLEEDIKISSTTVKNILDRNNVHTRTNGGIYKIPIEEIFELYINQNKTLKEIGKIYNTSPVTIRKVLIDNDIDRKSMSDYTNPNLAHDYFEEIDTEKKAYLLGFLIADGNIYRRKNGNYVVRLDIHEKDKIILDSFKKEICSNNKLVPDNRGCLCLNINSNKMASDLIKHGVIINKTFRTSLPKLEKDLMKHLIRGIFDGDGWASKFIRSGKNFYSYAWGICGSNTLMKQIRDYLVVELKIFPIKVCEGKGCYLIIWGNKKDIASIGRWIYNDATIYLYRKKDVIIDLM